MAVGLSLSILLAAILIGSALGGRSGAVRGVVFAFGVGMLGAAATVLFGALGTKHRDEDWTIVAGYAVLRAGSGASAIWLALGGGAAAGWTIVAFVVAYPIWMSTMRRRRGVT